MNTKTLLALTAVVVLDAIGFGIIFPIFPSLLFDQQWALVPPETSQLVRGIWLGLLISATPIVQMAISPLVGALSDRYGRRPCITSCLFVGAIGYVIAACGATYQSLMSLLAGRILIGIAIASFAVVNACIADLSGSDSEKGGRFALVNMSFGIGFIVGPLFGSLLSGAFLFGAPSISRPFWITGALSILNAFLAWLWLPETASQRPPLTEKPSGPLLPRGLVVPLVASFLFSFGWSAHLSMLPVWWIHNLGCSQPQVSLFISGATCVYVLICSTTVRPIMRRYRPLSVMQWSLLILALLLWLSFALKSRLASFWVTLPLQNIFAALLPPLAATVISDRTPREHQGRSLGLFGASEALGYGTAPIAGGLCLGVGPLFPTLLGGLCLLIAFCILLLEKYAKPTQS